MTKKPKDQESNFNSSVEHEPASVTKKNSEKSLEEVGY